MPAVVLESEIGSEYEDSPTSYEFPARYLRFFDRHGDSGPLIAVVYEPRGDAGRGRMAYVGMAEIVGDPEPTGRKNRSSAALWRVNYRNPVETFANPVPREWLGEPVETWLREVPRGRDRNVATFGRAVRALSDADLERILTLAGAEPLVASEYRFAQGKAVVATRERAEALVSSFVRAASFRREVLVAYQYRCAVTGLGIGAVAPTKSRMLLDAAHIRPVQLGGPDQVANGLPLTPTVHRLFDAGLLSVEYSEGRPRLRLSSRLEPSMTRVVERGVDLALQEDMPLLVPASVGLWPHPDYLRFHRERVFQP